MIRFAEVRDIDRLKHIWSISFGDEWQYIDLYFKYRFKCKNTLVYEENNQITAMLTMLPITICYQNKEYSAQYIYAAATLPEYRGNGVITKLMDYSHEYSAKCGRVASLLVPGSNELFDFYKKRGYVTEYYYRLVEMDKFKEPLSTNRMVGICNATACEIKQMRDLYFSKFDFYCKWDLNAIKYQLKETKITKGYTLKFIKNGVQGYCICYNKEKELFVSELCAFNLSEDEIFHALVSKFKPNKIKMRLACDSKLFKDMGQVIPFGMSKYIAPVKDKALFSMTDRIKGEKEQNTKPYMGLMLD